MRITRFAASAVAMIGLAALGGAQISGPTPLAWRWAGSTTVAPSGSPIVENDRVYVAVGGRVYGLDRETGNQKWKYPLADPIDGFFRTGCVMADGLLVAAGDNKVVYAVDPATGEEKWTYTGAAAVTSAPVSLGKYVVVAMADDTLMALDSQSGKPAWTNENTPAPIKIFGHIQGSIAGGDNGVLVFTQDNELLDINVLTKKTTWRRRFANIGGDVEPVVANGMIYVNTGNYLSVLNLSNGVPRFQKEMGDDLIFNPSVSTTAIAVATRDGAVQIFNPNGSIMSVVDDKGKVSSGLPIQLDGVAVAAPAVVGTSLIVPTSSGSLDMYDLATRKIKWSFTIRPYTAGLKVTSKSKTGSTEVPLISVPAAGTPVSAGNALLVLAQDGSLLSFDNSFGVDLTPPMAKMTFPSPGAQVNGSTIDLVFQIDDEATGVNDSTLKITINGQPAKYEFGRDGVAVVRIGGTANPPLSNGRAAIAVSVADWLGNQSAVTYNLYIDNSLKPTGGPNIPKKGPGGGAAGKGAGGGGGVGG